MYTVFCYLNTFNDLKIRIDGYGIQSESLLLTSDFAIPLFSRLFLLIPVFKFYSTLLSRVVIFQFIVSFKLFL